MKAFPLLILPRLVSSVTALVIGALSTLSAQDRTWTAADGRTLVASLVEYDASVGSVRIKRKDGKEFTLRKDALSAEDAVHLDKIEADQEEARQAIKAKAEALAGKTASHVSTGEYKVPFHVYYPKSYDGTRKLPLLILFSPGGGGRGIMKNFMEPADGMEWVVVGCDQFKNGMDEAKADRMFAELLPDIEKIAEHDSEILYMGGMSGGAMRSYDYSARFDRPWKGIVACGGWLGGPQNWDQNYTKNMAVAMVNGDGDKAANSWIERDTAILKKFRSKVRTFEFPGGHVVAPPEVLLEAMRWIQSEQE